MIDTPELDKMLETKPDSQIIGEFIDWLFNKQHVQLCRFDDKYDEFVPVFKPTEQWLAEFFDIDLSACEQERRMILDNLDKWTRTA